MDSFSFGHILSRKLYYEKFLSHYKQRGVKKWKTHKICQIILFTPMADAPLIPAVTELMLLSSFIQIQEKYKSTQMVIKTLQITVWKLWL